MRYSAIIEGLQIFAKYDMNGLEGHLGGADHDVIYGPGAEINEADYDASDAADAEGEEYEESRDQKITEEDNARLYELAWFVSSDTEGWQTYV